ncbi:10396_t:CDS:2 [Acaulospora colombiana]|uniref:10396_t:CDS:1 n=1 Tax=Acaulospora colombiana TaxID=27376 RepID=A0ACA9KX57_9GLOM|nr:10396_t:CDS:2 [Acaulospora colombiana]
MSSTSNVLFLTGGMVGGLGLLYGIYALSQRLGQASTSNKGKTSTKKTNSGAEFEDETRFHVKNKESQNLLNLLYSIAEDQARKANPRSVLLNVFYPGRYTNFGELARDKLYDLQKRTHFDQVELEALYDQFRSLATVTEGEGGIDKGTFEQCLGPLSVERNLVTERIFQFFDQDGDDIINFNELVVGLSILCKGNLEEKIEYVFRGYDLNGDGFISRDELQQIFKAYFHISTELVRDVVKAMEEEMLENYDSKPSQSVATAFHAAIPSENYIQYTNQKSQTEEDNDTITWQEKTPVVECLGQDAIEEIVEKIFTSIDTNSRGYISYDEFKEYVQRDKSVVAWFDVFGR